MYAFSAEANEGEHRHANWTDAGRAVERAVESGLIYMHPRQARRVQIAARRVLPGRRYLTSGADQR